MAVNSSRIALRSLAMMSLLNIGPKTCVSSDAKRPSHISRSTHARLSTVWLRLGIGLLPAPIETLSGSLHANDGVWQVAHERLLSPDSRGSKNSISPSFDLRSLYGLSFGNGIAVGRR